jgi:methylase of polypeptide subunit release factors
MAEQVLRHKAEFGDFQTPGDLARQALSLVKRLGWGEPATVIEPSCGSGAFLVAAAETFPKAHLIGLDIRESHLAEARRRLARHPCLTLVHGSFFNHDWDRTIGSAIAPVLVTGNPPWVTNSALSSLGSDNLPMKSNFEGLRGIDAITGRGNFDISEWMLLQNLSWLEALNGTMAVLCKTSVARKVLARAWKHRTPITNARIHLVDALQHFGAAVDACLLLAHIDNRAVSTTCTVYQTLADAEPSSTFGLVGSTVVSDVKRFQDTSFLGGKNSRYTWRSGIKHDCAKVMELEWTSKGLLNGYGEKVNIEGTYLYPLVKSSDISGKRSRAGKRSMIVPQRSVGDDTKSIALHAPRTWAYLMRHKDVLDARASVIYRGKPAFSTFGVGSYTFKPWKVAISGLYKRLSFRLFGMEGGKSVVFDDTVYFLSFDNHDEAKCIHDLLSSELAQTFLNSIIFWNDKRPITAARLIQLDIDRLAETLGRSDELRSACQNQPDQRSLSLFAKSI